MQMLRRIFQKLFGPEQTDDLVSVVLLLKTMQLIEVDALKAAVERAFGPAQNVEKRHVICEGRVTFIVEGPHFINLISVNRPYDIQEPPSPKLWVEHHAWCALDHMNKELKLHDRRMAIARVAAELINENCIAVYLGHKGKLLSNDQNLKSKLISVT
jgi:hypothetical protein